MRRVSASIVVLAALCRCLAAPAAAQERIRISINVGQQTTSTTVSQEQTFDQYFEQGSFTFERDVPKARDLRLRCVGSSVARAARGRAVSMFDKTGAGTLTAHVPHPLQFNKPRTTTGDIADATAPEIGQHITFGWTIPAASGLDFLLFAGPSIFSTEQLFVKSLTLSLDKEVFPFDELAFPGRRHRNTPRERGRL